MKITILGSGGGEGYPALFCSCDHCETARRVGGKSMRTLHQTLINDDLLIDLPSDTARHFHTIGRSLGDIPNILVTHVHSDHFQPYWFNYRGSVYAHNMKYDRVGLYGSSDVLRIFDKCTEAYPIGHAVRETIDIVELTPFVSATIGRYKVTPLPAKHAKNLKPYNYIIEEGGKTLVYLHDTGYPNDEVLAFLTENYKGVDAVMLDATMGVMECSDEAGHMSFWQDKRLAVDLCERGIADSHTQFVANHITHNQAETHETIEEIFRDTDIKVAYDGMILEL